MTIYGKPKVRFVGGDAIHVDFCDEISLDCNRRVHAVYYAILNDLREGRVLDIVEAVPAYSSLTIFYDPRKVRHDSLTSYVSKVFEYVITQPLNELVKPRVFKIPVAYGGEFGPDFNDVLKITKLTAEEFIRIHTSKEYTCYMLGFTPGFLYLGDVDDRIAVPRLETPRTKIPAGSVGIAGKQTGLYGVESPGGWRLVGRTPIKTFDYRRTPPIPIKPGDLIRFYAIDCDEYLKLKDKFVDEVQ